MDFWKVLEYSLSVTVVGLLIWLVKLVFHNKLDARWHYFIWLVLLVRLIIPLNFSLIRTPVSVFQGIPVGRWIEYGQLVVDRKGWNEALAVMGRVYLWGAALLGGYYLAIWAILRFRLLFAAKADEDTRQYVEGIAVKYGLKGCNDIRICKSSTPYICGLIHPILVLPEGGGTVPEGDTVPEGCTRPEGDTVPEGCTGPEGDTVLEGCTRPEGDTVPEGCMKPEGDMALEGCTRPEGALWSERHAALEGRAGSETHTWPAEPVIVHELLHRKWKDVAVNMALHVVRVVNWFNPVIWFLTGVVQNDGEALCDQRVLECFSEEMEKDYGEMLLAMSRDRRRNPVKAGTSNMAGSYRNMRTRIRRICDFHKVPAGIGFVAACITLMLAAAGVGASAEAQGYEIHVFETEEELQRELLKAQLYHARTPEEAVWLFLRAAEERNVFYRMSVLPGEDVEEFEEFVQSSWRQGSLTERGSLVPAGNGAGGGTVYPFPQVTGQVSMAGFAPLPSHGSEAGKVDLANGVGDLMTDKQYLIYNLQYDEERGTATVFVRPGNGAEGAVYTEWELALVREDGWKVRLAGDAGRMSGAYQEPSLLSGSAQAGDFRLEMSAYNEAYFDSLGHPQPYAGLQGLVNGQDEAEADVFPENFSMEYKVVNYYIAYVGQESLEGHSVRVEVTKDGKEVSVEEIYDAYHVSGDGYGANGVSRDGYADAPDAFQGVSGDGYADAPDASQGASGDTDTNMKGVSYSASGDSYVVACFDGSELDGGEPRLVGGGGNGSSEAGQGWKADDRLYVHVRIYVDGTLVEESDIWSGEH